MYSETCDKLLVLDISKCIVKHVINCWF